MTRNRPEQPVIVLAGDAAGRTWAAELAGILNHDFHIAHYDRREGYVSRLADDHAALVIVDGDRDDWRFWATTPKTSPATRRIPVFLISDSPQTRALALTAGADMALPAGDLLDDLTRLVREFARVFDPALAEQLDCECQETLPELAEQGVQKFNEGEFYQQHDLFEALWVETQGPVRDLYRAILQVGVGYFQILRGNHRGARKMLLRSVQWLAILPDECQGIDVKALREDSYRVRAELEKLDESEIGRFDTALLQPIKRARR